MAGLQETLKRKWHVLAAAAIIAAQAALTGAFIAANSPTCDEPTHLCGGLDYLKNADLSVNPESGVLPQAWAALPNLAVEFPPASVVAGNVRIEHSLYREKIHPVFRSLGTDRIYAKSRWMVALLSFACAIAIFMTARRIAGRLPALLATALYAFFPLFLSNGALVTADMAVTLFFLLSCLALWRLFRKISLKSALLAAAAVSCLCLSKMSAPLLGPSALLMAALKGFSASPVGVAMPSRPSKRLNGAAAKLAACLLCLASLGFAAWLAIWAAYGFRYSGSPEGAKSELIPVEYLMDSGAISKCAKLAMDAKLLPEAFIYGFLHTRKLSQQRWSFLDGEMSMTGFRSFFPKALLMKTPPAIIIAIVLGLACVPALLRTKIGRARLFHLLPVLSFAAVYVAFALSTNLNIGFRHLMPAFPAMILLCALGFRALLRSGKWKAIPFLLAAWCASEALLASPSQLAYFSPLYGGSGQAWRHLVDSSLDWGQDLRNLRGELEKAGVDCDGGENVYIAYFGSVPASDCGVKASFISVPMSSQFNKGIYELSGGVYCVSATVLQGVNTPLMKPELLKDQDWLAKTREAYSRLLSLQKAGRKEELAAAMDGKTLDACYQYELLRFERLRSVLAASEPLFSAGGSILVFKVKDEEAREILGPEFAASSPPPLK